MGKDLEKTLNDNAFWHFRYQQQARWTLETRRYLFNQTGVQPAHSILDVGCGSGAVLETLAAEGFTHLAGIDIDPGILNAMQGAFPGVCADGTALPFRDQCFDHAMCHFTLLWVTQPHRMICEMRRVVKPGGWVFALAEPDYGARVSYPPELEKIADLQTAALEKQGADTRIGRTLMAMLASCGLGQVSGGIIGAETRDSAFNPLSGDLRVLKRDLAADFNSETINQLLDRAQDAASAPGAVWHVPTCFACGMVA